jgi:TonB family protein
MSSGKNHREQYEKYLKREMSNEEAHAFEREILKNSFDQEALEGLEKYGSQEVFDDIERLQSKIQIKKGAGRSWLKIAAVVSFLVASSVAVWLTVNPVVPQEELAMESQNKTTETKEVITPKTVEESIDTDANIEEEILVEESDKVLEIAKKATEPNPALITEISEPTTSETEEKGLEEVVDADVALEESAIALQSGAGFADDELEADFVEDNSTLLEAEPNEVTTRLNATGAVSRALINETEDSIIQEETGNNKGDVADALTAAPTMAMAKSRSSTIVKPEINEDVRPAGGDENFQKYIQENLIYPDAAKENSISGTVILELTISANGEIANIDVKRSLGYGCDTEAIRLTRVRIRFKN